MKKIGRPMCAAAVALTAGLALAQTPQPSRKFTVQGSSTGELVVTDSASPLTWQATYATQLNWQDAVAYCAQLNYAGSPHWRLPTVTELYALVEWGPDPGPRRYPATSFPAMPSACFWSKTPGDEQGPTAWSTYFDLGYTRNSQKESLCAARCTR